MKAYFAVALAAAFLSPVRNMPVAPPAGTPSAPETYPVRFHMVHVHYAMRQNDTHGVGQANVSEEGQPTRGFDFNFGNCQRFDRSDSPHNGKFPHELPGRWLGPNHLQLAVLRTDLGATPEGPNKDECILNGKTLDVMYVHQDGALGTVPLGSQPVSK